MLRQLRSVGGAMAAPRASAAMRGVVARTARRGLASDAWKGDHNPMNQDVGTPKVLQREGYINATHVLEEEETGFAPGLPMKRDSELWKDHTNPDQLVRALPRQTRPSPLAPRALMSLSTFFLTPMRARVCALLQIAERAELWWDDGTAEPEWFVDRGSAGGADGGRSWAQSTPAAVAQLLGMFGLLGCVMGVAYAIDDRFRTPAPRWIHGHPMDMHPLYGLENLPADGSKAKNGASRIEQYGVAAAE